MTVHQRVLDAIRDRFTLAGESREALVEDYSEAEVAEALGCDHITKPHSTTARIVGMYLACPLCGWQILGEEND